MKFKVAAAVILAGWVGGMLQTVGAQDAGSTWSGVYSEAQAKLGHEAYVKACAECHGEDLKGDGFAPVLIGTMFMNNWNGMTVGDLFERIRISMPPSDPNSVDDKQKAAIVAYVLQQNKFPAGTAELPADADKLKGIKFVGTKPGV